jgi:hypothetical protein
VLNFGFLSALAIFDLLAMLGRLVGWASGDAKGS